MEVGAEEWRRKGATLSDKTARSEYGLTQEEIYAAIDAGKLRYQPAAAAPGTARRLEERRAALLAELAEQADVQHDRQTHLVNPGGATGPTACAARSPPHFTLSTERPGFLAR